MAIQIPLQLSTCPPGPDPSELMREANAIATPQEMLIALTCDSEIRKCLSPSELRRWAKRQAEIDAMATRGNAGNCLATAPPPGERPRTA